MSIRLIEKNGGKILEACVSGKLTHGDYQRLGPEFVRLVKQHGKISVLFEMVDFRGWQAEALWDDIKLDLKHFAGIERLAMVGERKWQKGMSKFCRPFTTARVRYFDRSAASEARAWLATNQTLPLFGRRLFSASSNRDRRLRHFTIKSAVSMMRSRTAVNRPYARPAWIC